MEIIEYLDQHNGFVMALLTFVYVAFTILIFIANSKSVKEMRVTREEENRPYIVAYIETSPRGITEFIIENIGKTMARDVEISMTPEFDYPKRRPLSKSTIMTKPIPSMAPNYQFKIFVGMLRDFKNKEGSYPIFEMKIKYKDSNKGSFSEDSIIDLNVGSDTMHLREKDIHDLTNELITFRKEFQKLQSDIKYMRNNIGKEDAPKEQVVDIDKIL